MEDFIPVLEFPPEELNRIRWLIRHHANELIDAGVAVKYGRAWHINRKRLPEALKRITKKAIRKQRAD